MGFKATIAIAGLFSLMSTSAFAGTATNASFVKSDTTRAVNVLKAPVLLKASTAKKLRIKRVVIEPVTTMVARNASTADHSAFVYKTDMNPRSKTYRPAVSNSASMPNHFKK